MAEWSCRTAITSAMVADVPVSLGVPDADGAHGLHQLVQVLLEQFWRLPQRLLQSPHIALVVPAGLCIEMLLLQRALNPIAALCKLTQLTLEVWCGSCCMLPFMGRQEPVDSLDQHSGAASTMCRTHCWRDCGMLGRWEASGREVRIQEYPS